MWERVQPDRWHSLERGRGGQKWGAGVTQKVAVLLAPTVERKMLWASCHHSPQFNSNPLLGSLALGKSSSSFLTVV